MPSTQNKKPRSDILPVLPVRDLVVFPYMIIPLFVGRDKSIKALEAAMADDRRILLVAQKTADNEEPSFEDLYTVGTAAEAMQLVKLQDGNLRVVIEGKARMRVVEVVQREPFYRVRVEEMEEPAASGLKTEALMRKIVSQFERMVQLGRNIPPEALMSTSGLEDPGRLADLVASYADLRVSERQVILETVPPEERLEQLNAFLIRELEILEIDQEIEKKVRDEVGTTQKEYILRERMKAIQEELGERDSFVLEIENLREQVAKAKMPEEAGDKALQEIDRLEKMPPIAPEGTVIRNYLDWLIALPWQKKTKDNLDIARADRILDEDHYGLKKPKERVTEFLAVRKLTDKTRGPILCFIGPPGVGKTSIGKSIARSLGRKFIRVSLGGIRDEAEVRGHRRTYVGAMPGRIIQALRRSGSRSPVFMLDEIDKIGVDFRGDPSSALLECLDPEQNNAFSDHYLEVPFDLSDVMFVATGNLRETIPPALRDRFEVIEFPGYIEEEKACIATQFLVPKQIKENGLKKRQIVIPDEMIRILIRRYTREAGVRNLEREIASICRKVAKRVALGSKKKTVVDQALVEEFLGPPRFHFGTAEEKDEVAVATGLAWSEAGGDVLSIEVSVFEGKGKLTLTGQLGDVMQESAQAALTYARSRAGQWGIRPSFFEKRDIHIHVPAGSIPKDGPSAGIAIATALVSALTQRPVRKDLAMTGEITLRGKILPVGGVKEKVLAAHRAGIKEVLLPTENQKDLVDIPGNVKEDLKFHFFRQMDDVLSLALLEAEKPRPTRQFARKAQPKLEAGQATPDAADTRAA